jgi:hypothetical protein
MDGASGFVTRREGRVPKGLACGGGAVYFACMMRIRITSLLPSAALVAVSASMLAQTSTSNAKPEDTELWEPVPAAVTAGPIHTNEAPSDAIALFDGKNTDMWVTVKDKSPVKWKVADGVMTVNKDGGGNIETKQKFHNYQLHIEWKVPTSITGTSQARGNSGVFLASTGDGDDGYELQVLDSYQNKTYVNGMAGSLYKQAIPLANPTRKPGEWNVYDVVWTAPTFQSDGSLKTPAFATVFFNGVVVENHFELKGETRYIGKPYYKAFDGAPIKLQAHGDKSEPISFRNIWVRELK